MTLPIALLIASSLDAYTAAEIRESVKGSVLLMEPISCTCGNDLRRICSTVPNSTCPSDRSSPTSDLGSEISSSNSSSSTIRSYSYFSDSNSIEEITYTDNADPKSKEDLLKSLGLLVDILENVEARFTQTYMFGNGMGKVSFEKMKIIYQGRDLLDLGNHMKQSFPLAFSRPEPESETFNKYWPKIGVETHCPNTSCEFSYLHPLA